MKVKKIVNTTLKKVAAPGTSRPCKNERMVLFCNNDLYEMERHCFDKSSFVFVRQFLCLVLLHIHCNCIFLFSYIFA